MHVVCKDHLELAIDRFIDEFEDAPDIVDLRVTHFKEWTPEAHCQERECEQEAIFLVV
jgi:CxxH/CxxC protein (TIGR04129 family)